MLVPDYTVCTSHLVYNNDTIAAQQFEEYYAFAAGHTRTYWGGDLYLEPNQLTDLRPTLLADHTEGDHCVDANWQDTSNSPSYKIDYVFKKGRMSCARDAAVIDVSPSDHHLIGGYLPVLRGG